MIEYVCPECGGKLDTISLMTDPPQEKVRCRECDWKYTEPQEEIVKIPYVPKKHRDTLTMAVQLYDTSYIPPACKHCSNHPSNGGSGICHCTLGSVSFT